MNKLYILFFIFFISFTASSQISRIYSDEFPDSAKARVGITAEYELNSNALTSSFLSKFYKGGYIDEELKNSVLRKVKNNNRMGANINFGVFAAFKPDSIFHKKHLSVFFSLQDREHFDCKFSKDLFKVSFYGNAAYAGKTADFNNFELNLLRYQQLQIGLMSTNIDSAARWGIGLSFLKGEQYASIKANTAELFTSEDGQYIDFNTSMQVERSDTANKGLGAMNGYGASIDVFFEAPFKTRLGNSKIHLSVADIGLIHFNDKSLYLKQDSLFHYTGFTVNSIFDLQDSTFSNTSQDSIVKRIVPFKKQPISVTIPATMDLYFETEMSKHFTMTEGIRYVFNANYNLMYFAKGTYEFNRHFALSATVGYGGYGNFHAGFGIYGNFGKGFVVYAGSNDLGGLIVPKMSCGQNAYISLIKNFK